MLRKLLGSVSVAAADAVTSATAAKAAPNKKEMTRRKSMATVAAIGLGILMIPVATSVSQAQTFDGTPSGAAYRPSRNPDFTLRNDTYRTITNVFVRGWDGNWSQDLLGSGSVPSGGYFSIHVPGGRQCHYDVAVRMEGGRDWTFSRIDLCGTNQLRVWYNRDGHVMEASSE